MLSYLLLLSAQICIYIYIYPFPSGIVIIITIVSDGIKGDGIVTFRILRASDTGSKTLAWNGDTWEGGNDGTQQANNSNSPVPNPAQIQYDQLLGWCWFTQYPWVYSYTNGSWYYLKSTSTGLYAWNATLPGSKWIKIFG